MGELTAFSPMNELKLMNEWLERNFNLPTTDLRFGRPWFGEGESLRVDVYDKNNVMIVRAALPGVKKEDVDIQINNNVLTIKAELKEEEEINKTDYYLHEVRHGMMHRNIRLPSTLDVSKVEATFKDGIVKIRIPHVEVEEEKPVKVVLR